MIRLQKKYHPTGFRIDVKLLSPVINVHKKQVVQKKILYEIVLVEPLLIRHQKGLDLKSSHLSDHVNIIAASLGHQDVFQLAFIKDLEKLVALHHLAVRRRIHKREHGSMMFFCFRIGRCQYISFQIHHTEINSGNHLQSIYGRL